MNFLFLPIVFCPIFCGDPNINEPYAHAIYVPVEVRGIPQTMPYVFITEDYHPYTHGFLPEDGSEDVFYDEPTPEDVG